MSYRNLGTKLYIGNLSSSTTRSDLEYEFEYYGRLINVWVAKNPPGFAYIDFEDGRDADDAIKGLDGREIHGRRIRVERSHGNPRGRRDERYRSNSRRPFHPSDRCYNCGESGHYAYDCDLYSRRKKPRRTPSRSRSRSPRRRRRSRSYNRRSRSDSRSRSRSKRRSPSRSRSRSHSRSQSRSKKSRSFSRSPIRDKSPEDGQKNGHDDKTQSRSRSRSHSRSRSR